MARVDAVTGRAPDRHQYSVGGKDADLRKNPLALLGSTKEQVGPNDVSRQGMHRNILGVSTRTVPGTNALGMYVPPKGGESIDDYTTPDFADQVVAALGGPPNDTIMLGEGGDNPSVLGHEFGHRAYQFNRPELVGQVGPAEIGGRRFGEEGVMRLFDVLNDPRQLETSQAWFDQQDDISIDLAEFLEDEEVLEDLGEMQQTAARKAQEQGAPRPYEHDQRPAQQVVAPEDLSWLDEARLLVQKALGGE